MSTVTLSWRVEEHLYEVRIVAGEWVPPLVPVGDAPPYRWDKTGVRRFSDAFPGLVRQAEEHLSDLAGLPDVKVGDDEPREGTVGVPEGTRAGSTGRRDEGVWEVLPGHQGAPVPVLEDHDALRKAVRLAGLVGEADGLGVSRSSYVAASLSGKGVDGGQILTEETAVKRIQRARTDYGLPSRGQPRTCGMSGCGALVRPGGTAWCEEHRSYRDR